MTQQFRKSATCWSNRYGNMSRRRRAVYLTIGNLVVFFCGKRRFGDVRGGGAGAESLMRREVHLMDRIRLATSSEYRKSPRNQSTRWRVAGFLAHNNGIALEWTQHRGDGLWPKLLLLVIIIINSLERPPPFT